MLFKICVISLWRYLFHCFLYMNEPKNSILLHSKWLQLWMWLFIFLVFSRTFFLHSTSFFHTCHSSLTKHWSLILNLSDFLLHVPVSFFPLLDYHAIIHKGSLLCSLSSFSLLFWNSASQLFCSTVHKFSLLPWK